MNTSPDPSKRPSVEVVLDQLDQGHAMGRCQMLLVWLSVAALQIGFCFVFTGMGLGRSVYRSLYPHYHVEGLPVPLPNLLMAIVCVLLIVLYLLDESYWVAQPWSSLKRILKLLCGSLVVVSGVFGAKRYPATTLMLFFVGIPLCLYVIREALLVRVKLSHFMKVLAHALIGVGAGIFIWFIVWIAAGGRMWTPLLKQQFMIDMQYVSPNGTVWNEEDRCSMDGCAEDEARYKCTAIDDWCEPHECGCRNSHYGAFLVWFAPSILGIGSVMFGFFCNVISWMLARPNAKKAAFMVELLLGAFAFLSFAVWCAASIAGAASNLSEIVIAGAAAAFVLTCVVMSSIVGFDTLKREVHEIPFIKHLADHPSADWMKAMVVLMCWPLLPMVLLLSAINQCARKCPLCPFTKRIQNDKERREWFTEVIETGLSGIYRWNFTSVFVKLIWIGGFFYGMQVGVAKVTNVFLSWLITALSDLDLISLTLVFMVVGCIMFLLPPIPGPPVYLTGAVLVTVKATNTFGGEDGGNGYFFLAIFYVTMVCLLIKLIACTLQQKVIGQMLGSNVSVRCAIGVNSLTIRAIKRVLMEKGLSVGKVCILCAGPDWPTSVLTGILGCNWLEMMIGTIPVYLLIAPVVLTGAFQVKAADGGLWGPVGQIITMVAGIILGSGGFAMVYIINKTARKYKAELEAEELDEAVAELERKEAEKAAIYNRCTHWRVLPATSKFCLTAAAVAMAAAFCLFNFGRCFRPFVITSIISAPFSEGGLEGNVLNLLLPQGVVAHILFLISIVFLKLFGCQARSLTKNSMDRHKFGVEAVSMESQAKV